MKLIIAGTRNLYLNSPLDLESFIYNSTDFRNPEQIVSGGAKGIDWQGEQWANDRKINLKIFEADWEKHGKKAGPIRNKEMAEYADQLLLIWNGESKGSKNMKKEMLKLNKPVHEIIIRTYNDKNK